MIHETDEDRRRQLAMVKMLFGSRPGYSWIEMPRLYVIDFEVLKDGRMVGVVECKSKTARYGEHSNYLFDVSKWRGVRGAAVERGVPAIVAVQFNDRLAWFRIDCDDPGYSVLTTGRRDRGDPGDQEPAYRVPWSAFHKLPLEE